MIVRSNTVMITTTDQRPRMGTLVMKKPPPNAAAERTARGMAGPKAGLCGSSRPPRPMARSDFMLATWPVSD
jgi:hypothetical protein